MCNMCMCGPVYSKCVSILPSVYKSFVIFCLCVCVCSSSIHHDHTEIFQLHLFVLWPQHKTSTMSDSKINDDDKFDLHFCFWLFAICWPYYCHYILYIIISFPFQFSNLLTPCTATSNLLLQVNHPLPALSFPFFVWSLPSRNLPPLLTATQ